MFLSALLAVAREPVIRILKINVGFQYMKKLFYKYLLFSTKKIVNIFFQMFKYTSKTFNLYLSFSPDVCNTDDNKGNEVLDQAKHVLVPEAKKLFK